MRIRTDTDPENMLATEWAGRVTHNEAERRVTWHNATAVGLVDKPHPNGFPASSR